ncbi:MAG: c-type cytochrome [Burkholderiaceae bacterium]
MPRSTRFLLLSCALPVLCLMSFATSVRAQADAARGALAWQKNCTECHTVDKDDTGPHHAGVAGRRAGSVPGFPYSAALKATNFIWDAALLDRWIANPDAMVPGQAMDFKLSDAAVRADIVAYLLTLQAPK